jgi:glutamyl-Q tRNA(Asp) synthetase
LPRCVSKPRNGGNSPNGNSATGTIATGKPYIGRFAPSPTGPLHFGSLVAAVASYLQARVHNGLWLLRIEDIDPPREQQGAIDLILRALEAYGFQWDGNIIRQSQNRAAHDAALAILMDQGQAYRCRCSRKDLASAPVGPLGRIYPGTCRDGCDGDETAIRLRTVDKKICFDDLLQGTQCQRLESESGDFIIRRRDGLIAYQLAVVVDDEDEGVTEVVRGIDIMASTQRQIWLQRLLSYRTPAYVHIPVVTHADGDKLSKLTGAPGIPLNDVERYLVAALAALQQSPPEALADANIGEIWQWAMNNWKLEHMQHLTAVTVDSVAANFLTETPSMQ